MTSALLDLKIEAKQLEVFHVNAYIKEKEDLSPANQWASKTSLTRGFPMGWTIYSNSITITNQIFMLQKPSFHEETKQAHTIFSLKLSYESLFSQITQKKFTVPHFTLLAVSIFMYPFHWWWLWRREQPHLKSEGADSKETLRAVQKYSSRPHPVALYPERLKWLLGKWH